MAKLFGDLHMIDLYTSPTPNGWKVAMQQVREKFLATWSTGMCYWPLVAFVSYRLVPTSLRTLYIGVTSFIWFTVLAHLRNRTQGWRSPVMRLLGI